MDEEGSDNKEGATFLATTSKDEPRRRRTTTTTKIGSVQEDVRSLQETVERLQQQLTILSGQQQQHQQDDSLLGNELVKQASKRLRFDSRDVHGSIESWNHFFRLYEVNSDYLKFFAVEQILPAHLQRAMAANKHVQSSYNWLIQYLKEKYDPKYSCYEMASRSINKSTNLNEIEDLAVEAANCPTEHLVKHFMLEACSQYQRQRMKPFLLLSMKEFKFKLKMIVQEDGGRYYNNSNYNKRVNAISQDGESTSNDDSTKDGQQSSSQEFKKVMQSNLSGNGNA